MKIKKSSYEYEDINTVTLHITVNKRDVEKLPQDLKGYELEIKKPVKRRSLNANAYMWVLCDKIAQDIGSSKDDVYRQAIRDRGVMVITQYPENVADMVINAWNEQGIGNYAERLESRANDGCVNIRMYLGSSVYNSTQMGRLIEWLVEEAEELDIEVMTPDEISRIVHEWGK